MARGANLPDRPISREYRRLGDLIRFVRPYRLQVVGGTLALLVSAGTVLALGAGMRYLVDRGFGLGDPGILDQAVLALFGVTVIMALSTYCRFYLVTWVGERVVADVRKAVFDHLVRLSPGFFEVTRTGEVISRLTTDTTLLQQVVGSSASIALRNSIMMVGATVMLFITSPKLTG
ncbi:MAG: ABC transporter, partial [Rhodospirillaceae bacterium]|nr:ABC transporter [Rhodospirillaceae bacterium]